MIGSSEWITIGGEARALTVRPASAPPWPALLVMHAVMGIDGYMRDLAGSFADKGYCAVVPDLYAHDAGYKQHHPEHIEAAAHMVIDPKKAEILSRSSGEARDAIRRARDWIVRRPTHTYLGIILTLFQHVRASPEIRRIGALGFCMGGRLVGELAATSADLAAGVIHYGAPPSLDLVPKIRAPLEGHYATTDSAITNKVPSFAAAMKSAGKEFAYYIYDADHGFTLRTDRFLAAKRLAMRRSQEFLSRNLRPSSPADAEE